MSGFAAVFRFDGAPADSAALGAMIAAIAYRGPDGSGRWAEGPAAIGHLMLHTTAESLEDIQPLANEDGSLVLAMDGWLANCDELRIDLLARGAVLRTRSDAELVLRAYETWRDDSPKHIDGEYAFVVWDARRREAFCARDHAGRRPMHYHWDGKRLLVASDLAGVLAAGDFEQRPNRDMLAEHLAFNWFSREETLWDGVMRPLPAHTMRVGADGPTQRRYWTPPLEVSIRYPRDEDYQAHYRALLEDAVRRASRSHLPLACDVSGGLDSSAIYALANELEARGQLRAPGLKGYTYNFGPDARADIDEVEYARAVANHLGTKLREVAPFMPELAWYLERGLADRDLAPHPNTALAANIGRALTADGCRVDLIGSGGNEFLDGTPFYFGDQLAEGDWHGFARSFREDAAAIGLWSTLKNVFRYGIRPNAPAVLRSATRRFRTAGLVDYYGLRFGWLSADMRKRLYRRRLLNDSREWDAVRSPARRRLLSVLRSPFVGYGTDRMNRAAARVGYELRSPMYSREYIEFAFATPETLRFRGGVYKQVHVKALEGSLPEAVLHRRTAVHFALPFERLLDIANPIMLARLLQCGIDWFDPVGLEKLYECYRRGPSGHNPIYEPWAIVGCENLFCQGARDRPNSWKEL